MTHLTHTLFVVTLLASFTAVRADDAPVPDDPETDELVRDLLGEAEDLVEEAETADSLKKALESMERASRRLGDDRDSGETTRDLQKQAIDSLDRLIELAKKRKPQGSSNGSPPQDEPTMEDEGEGDEPMEEPAGPGDSGGNTGGERRTDDENATESSDVTSAADAAAAALAERRRLVKDVWGHLPPAVRQELLNAYGDRALPKYESLVRAYYRALAEKSNRPE